VASTVNAEGPVGLREGLTMNREELKAHIAELRGKIKSLDEEFRNQALPKDKQEEWDRLEEERESSEKLLSELEFRAQRIEELSGDERHREDEPTGAFHTRRSGAVTGDDIYDLSTIRSGADSPRQMARELEDRGKREIERMRPAHPEANREDVQGHLERMQMRLDGKTGDFSRHLLATGSPEYRRAFISGIAQQQLTESESRAMALTPGEEGGFLLPYTLDPTIIPTSNGVVNPLRAISRVEQTLTNVWKGATSAGMTAKYREAEGEETTDDSPKIGQPEVTAHAADAFGEWTYEFGQDYGSMAPELAEMVQDAKDELEAVKLFSGSGEKEPFGLLTGATKLIETAASVTLAVGDIYALEQALPPRFRARGAWVGNRAIYNKIRQFDTAGGASLWVRLAEGLKNAPTGNMDQRLLDYPTNELSTMESAVVKLKTILLFGDFRYFLIADRIGMMAKPIDNIPGEHGRPTGKAGLYFFWRNGAKVISENAFRGLKVKE
jgi:HK97 family phage major capsid protein